MNDGVKGEEEWMQWSDASKKRRLLAADPLLFVGGGVKNSTPPPKNLTFDIIIGITKSYILYKFTNYHLDLINKNSNTVQYNS